MGVRVCEICKEKHDYVSGFFTRHLKEIHGISLENYIILTEYNNTPPKCECDLCDEKPQFYRGKFRTHTSGHKKFDKRKELYLGKYGEPICPTCGDIIKKWHRGEPRKYCKTTCQPNKWNQDKVNNTVKEKYGVDNVFQIPEIIEKIRWVDKNTKKAILTKRKRYDNGWFDVRKMKKTMLEKYNVENPSQIPENRKKLSIRMKKNNPMYNPETVIKSNNTLMDNLQSGKTKLYNTKKYKDTGLYYQSSYELEFIELCESLNILNEVKNGNSYNYLKEEWGNRMLTDFSIGDYEIEIKSTYVMERQGGIKKVFEKRDTVLSNNKKYIFILDKDYTEFLGLIKTLT